MTPCSVREFQDEIYQWVTDAGFVAIWEQEEPRPKKLTYPFVSMLILENYAQSAPDEDTEFYDEDVGEELLHTKRLEHAMCLRIGTHSLDKASDMSAYDIMDHLREFLHTDEIITRMTDQGIVFNYEERGVLVPYQDAGSPVQRLVTDFYFTRSTVGEERSTYVANPVGTVTVNGETEDFSIDSET